jgi:hypothetical protein
MDSHVTFTLEQAKKAQKGHRYSSTPSLTSALVGVGSEGRVPAPLPKQRGPVAILLKGWIYIENR